MYLVICVNFYIFDKMGCWWTCYILNVDTLRNILREDWQCVIISSFVEINYITEYIMKIPLTKIVKDLVGKNVF